MLAGDFRFKIQRQVGWLVAGVAALALVANLANGLARVGDGGQAQSIILVNALSLIGIVGLVALTTLFDNQLSKISQVALFALAGAFGTVVNDAEDHTGVLLIAAALILTIQYSLVSLRGLRVLLMAAIAFVAVAAAINRGPHAEALMDSLGTVIFAAFFLAFVWLSFSAEIKAHIAAKGALAQEIERNQAFVYLGKNLASVVHNLGTTVVSLGANDTQLRGEASAGHQEIAHQQTELISRLHGAVGELMALLRPTAAPAHRRVDLNQQIEQLAEHYRVRDTQVELDLDEQLPLVTARPIQLLQLLENVIDNAVEAVRQASAADHGASPSRRFVRVSTRGNAHAHTVSAVVTDQGTGIRGLDECHNSECAAYFEFGKTTKSDGTGLGVPYVLRTAAAEGWDVHIRSASPGGTTVTMTIPILSARAGSDRSDRDGDVGIPSTLSG
jgi:signal transduction histidine kinase